VIFERSRAYLFFHDLRDLSSVYFFVIWAFLKKKKVLWFCDFFRDSYLPRIYAWKRRFNSMSRRNAQVDADRLGRGEPTLNEVFMGEPNRNDFLRDEQYVVRENNAKVYSFIMTKPMTPGTKQVIYWRINPKKSSVGPPRHRVTATHKSGSLTRLIFTSEPMVQKWRKTTGLIEGYAEDIPS